MQDDDVLYPESLVARVVQETNLDELIPLIINREPFIKKIAQRTADSFLQIIFSKDVDLPVDAAKIRGKTKASLSSAFWCGVCFLETANKLLEIDQLKASLGMASKESETLDDSSPPEESSSD